MDTSNFIRLQGPLEIASAEACCWKCNKPTPVHAVLAADLEEFEEGDEPIRVAASTFVYDLRPDSIPPAVEAQLALLAPNYKPTYSQTVGQASWANVCVHCGALQGTFFMHNEPDGPFFGGPDEFDGTRTPLSEHGFDVDGAGYGR